MLTNAVIFKKKLKFHFLFSKIFMNEHKHNTDYDFLNFKIIIDFIY